MDGIRTQLLGDYVINWATGPITPDEVLHYVSEHITSWRDKDVIWEVTEADLGPSAAVRWRHVMQMSKPLVISRAGGRTALVAQGDFNFGMMRMFAILARQAELPITYRAFRQLSEAKTWLLTAMAQPDSGATSPTPGSEPSRPDD